MLIGAKVLHTAAYQNTHTHLLDMVLVKKVCAEIFFPTRPDHSDMAAESGAAPEHFDQIPKLGSIQAQITIY